MNLLVQWAVTSSALILIVLAARALFRNRLSARLRYALWGVALLRLLVPFQVELPAPVSDSLPLLASNLAPEVDEWMDGAAIYSDPIAFYPAGWKLGDEGATGKMPDAGTSGYQPALILGTEEGTTYYDFALSKGDVIFLIWAVGAGTTALVILLSNLRFARSLRKRRRPLEVPDVPVRVYTAEGLPSPCLFGVLRPAVYVTRPAADDPDTLRHVLAHELTHYAHRDHLWSLLRCLALALHWYNPLVWLAVALSRQDGELACDEGAVARLGEAERISYGRTLVDMVARQPLRPADLLSCSTAMTGGGKSVQQRVAQIVKKPETVKAALFAVVTVVALAAVFTFTGRAEPVQRQNGMFLDYLDRTTAIGYCPPLYSSTFYPDPITSEDLLVEAKEALSGFRYLEDSDPQPDLSSKELMSESRIFLTFEDKEMEYSLLWQNDYTYLFPGSIFHQYLDLKEEEGETARLWGVSGTCISRQGDDVISILQRLANGERRLLMDPMPMLQSELEEYTRKLSREGAAPLLGRLADIGILDFHYGCTSGDDVWLWYRGDKAHDTVWVLSLKRSGEELTILDDQPMEVFNAARNAGEETAYEQLGPGAFAAFLRPEDVVSVTAGGRAVELDIPALKELLVQGLYRQRSAEYDEEKYGKYVITVKVEKDVGYYLKDGGTDGLTLSVGSEPDVVCMSHRILASPQGMIRQYIYSPELYRAIRDLFD